MTNKKNNDFLYFKVMSDLPWYLSVIIALGAYIFCAYYAPVISTDNFIFKAALTYLPSFAPYIAAILAIPAPVSFFRSRRKAKRLDSQHSIYSIQQLGWNEFEQLTAEAFRRQGYKVIENEGKGADGGIDLRLVKDGHLTLVQCKHWKSNRVGVSIVREMYGVLVDQNATHMIIVCSGEYTNEAEDFARNKPITLIGGKQLLSIIGEVRKAPPPKHAVTCPQCQAELIERVVKKGPKKGERFMGCSRFPKCRFTQW